MNSVERVKAICKKRRIAISKLEKDLKYSNGYIGQLRKGVFPDNRLSEIAQYLGVDIDDLLPDPSNPMVRCEECGAYFNSFKEKDILWHEETHKKWALAVKKFGFCWSYIYREKIKADARNKIAEKNLSIHETIDAQIDIFKALFSRSLESNNYSLEHVSFSDYIAMLLNQDHWKKHLDLPVYGGLVERYGTKEGIPYGTYYSVTQNNSSKTLDRAIKSRQNHSTNDTLDSTQTAPLYTSEAMKLAKDYDGLDSWGKEAVDAVVKVERKRCGSLSEKYAAHQMPNVDPLDVAASGGTEIPREIAESGVTPNGLEDDLPQ